MCNDSIYDIGDSGKNSRRVEMLFESVVALCPSVTCVKKAITAKNRPPWWNILGDFEDYFLYRPISGAEYCGVRVCPFVRLFHCRTGTSGIACSNLTEFSIHVRCLCPWLGTTVAALRYVLPVLWMASCRTLHFVSNNRQCSIAINW